MQVNKGPLLTTDITAPGTLKLKICDALPQGIELLRSRNQAAVCWEALNKKKGKHQDQK